MGKNKITLLHGFQAYPTKIEDTNLDRLKFLRVVLEIKLILGYPSTLRVIIFCLKLYQLWHYPMELI